MLSLAIYQGISTTSVYSVLKQRKKPRWMIP